MATHLPASAASFSSLTDSFQLSLEARNLAKATVTIYVDAVNLLGRYLVEHELPTEIERIERGHVEAFIADLLTKASPGTALNRYKSLQAFFRWAVEEEEIPVSPMAKMKAPQVPEADVPVLAADDLRRLLKACEGRGFTERRDFALILLLLDTGMRRGEAAGLTLDDVDLKARTVRVVGKGGRERRVAIGAKAAQALDRYKRVRAAHRLAATSDALWLGPSKAITAWGIADIVERRAKDAGIGHVHPHQFRHTFAHEWRLAGGSDDELMNLAGWTSREMLNRYGRSAAAERAREAHRRLSPGDRL